METFITPPTRLHFDAFRLTIDTEGHAETRGHQRLILGHVDLIAGLRLTLAQCILVLGLLTPLGPFSCRRKFQFYLHLQIVGSHILGLVHSTISISPVVALVKGLSRRQLTDQIAIAYTHILDEFIGTVRGAEKIVHHRMLQQLTNVGRIIDQRNICQCLAAEFWDGLGEIGPLEAVDATVGWL